MTNLLMAPAGIGLCLLALAGCKSVQSRSTTSKTVAAADKKVAGKQLSEKKAEPQEDMSIGRASYEEFVDNPNSSAWGRTPYHFGGGNSSSTGNGGSSSTGCTKRT